MFCPDINFWLKKDVAGRAILSKKNGWFRCSALERGVETERTNKMAQAWRRKR